MNINNQSGLSCGYTQLHVVAVGCVQGPDAAAEHDYTS